MRLAGLDRGPQGRALAEQVLLADQLVEAAGRIRTASGASAAGTGGAPAAVGGALGVEQAAGHQAQYGPAIGAE